MEKEKRPIKFRDLSVCLKIAIVLSWVVGTAYALAFLIGFMEGLLY